MILRRITEHVRAQNWTAIALDFFIVVLGILLAFQITEWSAERQQRIAEGRYLTELARDLQADVDELRGGWQQALWRLRIGETILKALDPNFEQPAFFPPPIEAAGPNAADGRDEFFDTVFSDYVFAALTSTFILIGVDYTFDELVQSGNLGVLSNRSLVNRLTAYHGRHERRRIEFEIAREQVSPLLGYLRDTGRGMADRATIDDAVELASADPRFLGFVKMAYFLALWQHTQLKPILDDAEATLNAVRQEIEDRT